MHKEIIYRLISPITSRRLIKKYKPDYIVCFQISSNLCDKWEKIYFLTLFLPRFKRPMNCYFFLSFFTSLSAEAKMRTPLICFVLLICVLGMEAKSISLQKGEAINYRFDLFTPKQVPSIVPLCWDSSIIFFVFVWKNIKPTPRNSKKWGIWESQVSQSCFKNLADDMWIISFDVHWLKSKWPS